MAGTNNPFEALGLKIGADADEIRAAYRALVKKCHPDQFLDLEEQKAAQEKLLALNLAYEAALKYLLEQKGFKVERQVYLPMFWDDVQLDHTYRMDLVINDNIIVELKAVNFVDKSHRRQLFNYMHLTHTEYGMLINFGGDSLFSEWYRRSPMTGEIDKIKLL